MQTLIDDLLELARHGDVVTSADTIDLAMTATDTWDMVSTPGATLDVKTDQHLQADESKLRQLLENMFRNVVEHASPDGQA